MFYIFTVIFLCDNFFFSLSQDQLWGPVKYPIIYSLLFGCNYCIYSKLQIASVSGAAKAIGQLMPLCTLAGEKMVRSN